MWCVARLEAADRAVALAALIMFPARARTDMIEHAVPHVYLDAQRDVGAARDEAARQRGAGTRRVDHLRLEGVDVGHVAADGDRPLPFQLIFIQGRVGEAEAARHGSRLLGTGLLSAAPRTGSPERLRGAGPALGQPLDDRPS